MAIVRTSRSFIGNRQKRCRAWEQFARENQFASRRFITGNIQPGLAPAGPIARDLSFGQEIALVDKGTGGFRLRLSNP